MKKNMGTLDRALRILVALILAALYFTGTISGPFGIAMLVVAGVFVLTSVISFCPLYTLFGISTCSTHR